MKNTFSIFTLILFFSANLFAQTLEELDKQIAAENGIKSKLKIDFKYKDGKPSNTGVKSSLTTYNENGDVLKKEYLSPKGEVTGYENYEYDDSGNRTLYERVGNYKYKKQSQYNDHDQVLLEAGFDGAENFRDEYKYNSQGKLSEVTYKSGTVIQRKLIYKSSGNTTNIEVYSQGTTLASKIKMEYNSNGDLIEETVYSAEGKELEKKVYKYNSASKIIEETKTQEGNFYYRITYTYTPDGKLKEIYDETLAKEKYAKKVYEYDTKGNLVKYNWRRNPSEDFNSKSYTYNEKGVCLTEHTYYPKSKFEQLSKFEYTYF